MLENIGIEEALSNGISLIEWPEIAANFIRNANKIELHFQHIGQEHSRLIEIRIRE